MAFATKSNLFVHQAGYPVVIIDMEREQKLARGLRKKSLTLILERGIEGISSGEDEWGFLPFQFSFVIYI